MKERERERAGPTRLNHLRPKNNAHALSSVLSHFSKGRVRTTFLSLWIY